MQMEDAQSTLVKGTFISILMFNLKNEADRDRQSCLQLQLQQHNSCIYNTCDGTRTTWKYL